MSAPYIPRGSSLAALVCAFFRANAEEKLGVEDIAIKWDVTRGKVHTLLSKPVEAQMLLRERNDSGEYLYGAGPRIAESDRWQTAVEGARPSDAATATASSDEGFSAAIWSDGQLSLHGIKPNDEDIVVLTPDQAAQVRRLLNGQICA